MRKKSELRADTTLAPEEEPAGEIYIRELPLCCLRSFKSAVTKEAEEGRRLLTHGCPCGKRWIVTSSLDPRVLGRFVTHAGPKVQSDNRPPAA